MNPSVTLVNQFGRLAVSSFRIEDGRLVNSECVINLTFALDEIFGEERDSIHLEECSFTLVDGCYPELTISSKDKGGTVRLRLVAIKGLIKVFI